MIGAKLPFVLADWEGLVSGRAWFDNGKTIVFGLVGGYFGVELAKAMLGVRVKTGDSFAVPVAAAVAVGRLACFVGGLLLRDRDDAALGRRLRRRPSAAIRPSSTRSAFHLAAALVLAVVAARGLFRGQLIKLYIIAYLIYRFVTEFIRPEPVLALGLTGYQWACLGLVPVFIGLWARDARAMRQTYAEMRPHEVPFLEGENGVQPTDLDN